MESRYDKISYRSAIDTEVGIPVSRIIVSDSVVDYSIR